MIGKDKIKQRMSETRPKTCKLKLIDLKNEFIKKRDY